MSVKVPLEKSNLSGTDAHCYHVTDNHFIDAKSTASDDGHGKNDPTKIEKLSAAAMVLGLGSGKTVARSL